MFFVPKEKINDIIIKKNIAKFSVEKPKATVFRTLDNYKRIFEKSQAFQLFAENPKGKFMIEIGPGKGNVVAELNEKVKNIKSNVLTGALGVDLVKRQDSDNAVIEYDILTSKLKNQADFVTMVWVLQHEPRRLEMIMKGLELLKYGGRMLFNTNFLKIATLKNVKELPKSPNDPNVVKLTLPNFLHHYLTKELGFKLKMVNEGNTKAYELQKPTEEEIIEKFGSLEKFEEKFEENKSKLDLLGVFFQDVNQGVPLMLPIYRNLPFPINLDKPQFHDLEK